MELPTPKSSEEVAAVKARRQQRYKDNRQRIIDHLKKRRLSNAAIAGIVGNIDIETGGTFDFQQRQTKSGDPRDPNIVPGGAYGLFQFDNPGKKAGHETWYKQYLQKTNKQDSAESQLDYFLDTINAGGDTQDPFYSFSKNVGAGNTGTIKGYFKSSEDPKTIADSITDRFLKPGKPHSDKRRASAAETFAELQPVDRTDVDPENQNIDQAAPIADVGDDVPSPEQNDKSFLDYIPVVRQIKKEFFAEGGSVNMEKQMELFEDGGLKDEGGTVDPVSGNEVPPGSTQEEVRDDIPAQLSEGEFVIPADVVRFIGLNNLMKMRQEAKMGLKQMEAMGQMGNSEEATIPDDLPFDINDLDMEDEPEYNVGGFVPGTPQQQQFGISGFQQATVPTTGIAQDPMQAASQPFVQPPTRPQQAPVPIMQEYKPQDIPTFQQTIGQTPGQYDELRTYKNEAGMTMQIPFKNGQPIYPIPEGYTFVDPEAIKAETVTTTPTTPQTTSVRRPEDDNKSPFDPEESAIYKQRIDIAKSLGLTLESFGEGLSGNFGSGYKNPEMIGKFTGTGLIIGKDGVLIDPITMSIHEQSGGGILGGISRFGDKTGGLDPAPYSGDFYKYLPPGLGEKIDNRNMAAKQEAWSNYFEKDSNPEQKEDDLLTWITETYRDVSDFGSGSMAAGAEITKEDIDAGIKAAKERAAERAAAAQAKAGRVRESFPTRSESKAKAASDAAIRAAAAQREYEESIAPSIDRRTQQDEDPGESGDPTSYSFESARGPQDGYGGGSMGGRAEGGLIKKPKPKTKKKMKRGGLASKK